MACFLDGLSGSYTLVPIFLCPYQYLFFSTHVCYSKLQHTTILNRLSHGSGLISLKNYIICHFYHPCPWKKGSGPFNPCRDWDTDTQKQLTAWVVIQRFAMQLFSLQTLMKSKRCSSYISWSVESPPPLITFSLMDVIIANNCNMAEIKRTFMPYFLSN